MQPAIAQSRASAEETPRSIRYSVPTRSLNQAGIPAPPSGTGYQGVIPAAALPAIPEWVTEAYDEWGQLSTPPPLIAPPTPARAAGIGGMDTKTLLMLAGGSLAILKMLKIF